MSNTPLGYFLFALDVYGVAILDVHSVLDVLLAQLDVWLKPHFG